MIIPNLKNMLIQHELFFERQTGEARDRGLKLVEMVRLLVKQHREQGLSLVTRSDHQIEQLRTAINKHGWKPTEIAHALKIGRATVYNRMEKYRIKLQSVACLMILALVMCGCTVPRLYRGEETALLIGRADFVDAAKHAPDFTREAIRTIGRLEYEYYQAKEEVRHCPKCREQKRQQLNKVVSPPVVRAPDQSILPPSSPPLPTRQ